MVFEWIPPKSFPRLYRIFCHPNFSAALGPVLQTYYLPNPTIFSHFWQGYAFENICFKHVDQIRKALQIAGVSSELFSWLKTDTEKTGGAQIDLLIDRNDRVINICEMKFSDKPFVIDKKYASELRNKVAVFRSDTETRKSLLLTFITTYGVSKNDYHQQLVDNEITMDDLFR